MESMQAQRWSSFEETNEKGAIIMRWDGNPYSSLAKGTLSVHVYKHDLRAI